MITIIIRTDQTQHPSVISDFKSNDVIQNEVAMALLELERIKLTLMSFEFDNLEISEEETS